MVARSQFPLLLIAACALLVPGLPVGAQTDIGQEEERPLPAISYDYRGYWYELETPEEGGSEIVVRNELSGDEYEETKRKDIENIWMPLYTAYLNGNFQAGLVGNADAGLPPISEEKARRMVLFDPMVAGSIRDNPNYQHEVIRQMAEWSSFYRQLELWNRYISESVIRERLPDSEKPTFDPSIVKTELPAVYRAMRTHADTVSRQRDQVYREMVMQIERHKEDHARFEEWTAMRERDMRDFAEKWSRQFDGSEFRIGNTLYLVRNIEEKPATPEEDTLRVYRAPNSVILDVAKEKKVTPFDLIEKDGSLVKPEE
ncbi:hypothetical protein JW916_15575 [Candidatus Sumerlaeota bacterium]|nr:hypothetical protein [Candidatus Sumerlaeota bacterium]